MPDSSRFDLARQSYEEVLDATKHQDDKIGRFLAAIAFLTGGALVFFDQGVLAVRYQLGGDTLPLGAWALGGFLVLVALSTLALILSMATPLSLPSAKRAQQERSHIFFLAIAGETKSSWQEGWSESGLERLIEQEYIEEARQLAVRADRKYARTREGAVLFLGAMVFFALAVVFSLDAVLSTPESSGASSREYEDLSWTKHRRAVVGLVLAMFSGLLLYFQYRSGQDLSTMVGRRREGRPSMRSRMSGFSVGWVGVLWPVFIVATVVGNGGRPFLASGAPVALLTGSTAVGFTVVGLTRQRPGLVAGTPGAAVASVLVSWAVVAIAHGWEEHQLAAAVAAVLLTLGGQFFDASKTLRHRLEGHLAARAADEAEPVVGFEPTA